MTKHPFIAILIGVAGVLTVGDEALAVYHPTLGRFIQRDPLGYPDGMNTYAGYHIMHGGVDPMGLIHWAEDDGVQSMKKFLESIPEGTEIIRRVELLEEAVGVPVKVAAGEAIGYSGDTSVTSTDKGIITEIQVRFATKDEHFQNVYVAIGDDRTDIAMLTACQARLALAAHEFRHVEQFLLATPDSVGLKIKGFTDAEHRLPNMLVATQGRWIDSPVKEGRQIQIGIALRSRSEEQLNERETVALNQYREYESKWRNPWEEDAVKHENQILSQMSERTKKQVPIKRRYILTDAQKEHLRSLKN